MRRDLLLEHFLLGAVCFTTSTTALASHPNRLFQRASTCADTSFTKCSQSGLPANFCCGPDTVCIPLAANTTVLCCPNGKDCSSIVPIPCDITQQNATLHPDNSLKTTALTSTLATCGSACCPFGYTCNDGVCDINPSQNFAPPPPSSSVESSSTAVTSTAKSTASSTAVTSAAKSTASSTALISISPTPTPTTTSTPQTSDTSTLPVEKTCDKFPVGAVLAGFFPGIALGIALTLAWVCFLGARRKKYRRSESSFGNPNPSPALSKISEPQLIRGDFRTDFLKKQPQTPSSVGSSPIRQGSLHRVKSLFRKSTSSNSTYPPRSPVPPIPLNYQKPRPAPRPVTPPLQREPSYEDINIFADGDTASALERARQEVRGSHQTTFSDMMQRSGLAGLQKGQPYVYKGNSTEQQSPLSQRNVSPRGKEI